MNGVFSFKEYMNTDAWKPDGPGAWRREQLAGFIVTVDTQDGANFQYTITGPITENPHRSREMFSTAGAAKENAFPDLLDAVAKWKKEAYDKSSADYLEDH